ncbi:MAG: ABC transporter permease [Propionibacteriaceae bacterium]|nr:ABC transporter permease [Propionibacteriaceae bacterium]
MALVSLVARRVGVFAVSLLGATVVVFFVAEALPGDVAEAMLGLGATPEALEALRHDWGLDRPAVIRYASWLGGLLHGDLGASYLTGRPAAAEIGPPLAVTCWLVGLALPLAVLAALPAGLLAALWRRRWRGTALSFLSQLGMAVPVFFTAIVLVVVFAVRLGWLPAVGYADLVTPAGLNAAEWARHLVLPVTALAVVQASLLARYVRSAFVEVLTEDYLRTARAVGWTRWRALLRHGARNAALSVVTVVGLQLGAMLVGAILVEAVFGLPGLGSFLLQKVANRDILVVQGVVILLVAVVLAVNLAVDLVYVALDPRLRQQGASRQSGRRLSADKAGRAGSGPGSHW